MLSWLNFIGSLSAALAFSLGMLTAHPPMTKGQFSHDPLLRPQYGVDSSESTITNAPPMAKLLASLTRDTHTDTLASLLPLLSSTDVIGTTPPPQLHVPSCKAAPISPYLVESPIHFLLGSPCGLETHGPVHVCIVYNGSV